MNNELFIALQSQVTDLQKDTGEIKGDIGHLKGQMDVIVAKLSSPDIKVEQNTSQSVPVTDNRGAINAGGNITGQMNMGGLSGAVNKQNITLLGILLVFLFLAPWENIAAFVSAFSS